MLLRWLPRLGRAGAAAESNSEAAAGRRATVPVIRVSKDPNSETIDVTMQEYGAKLAFHVIHPEYDRDGNILQISADEEGEEGEEGEENQENGGGEDVEDVVERRGGAKGGEAAADSAGEAKPLRVVGENNGGGDGDKSEEDGAAPTETTTTAEDGAVTTAGHAKTADAADGAVIGCVSWRQTGGCSPTGPREPDADQSCAAVIHSGASGYCECESGRRVQESDCDHETFRCDNACTGANNPLPIDHTDVVTAFAHDKLFSEMKGSNVNAMLGKQKPFFLVILCDCPADLDVPPPPPKTDGDNPAAFPASGINNANPVSGAWPLAAFHDLIRDAGAADDFTYVYVLPAAAGQFQLYSQYSVTKNKPWIVIDNIPHGAMNEKFRGPVVPGATAAQLFATVTAFKDYTLPLLVRSQPVPALGKVAGSGRVLRGARSTSHVVQVVSDTFTDIVLDPMTACFLLIYSPNCPASRSVIPILEDVATQHKEMENVTIARIDLTANDLPIRDLIVHHYPTAYLFPAGTGDAASHHPAYRAPLNFANYHGENTKHDVSKPHSHWSVFTITHFVEHEVMPEMEKLLDDE